MKTTKKHQVIMLPTENKSNLILNESLNILGTGNDFSKVAVQLNSYINYYHLYIVSGEEIKEGDWFIANQGVRKCLRIDKKDTQYPYVTKNSKGNIIKYSRHWNTKIIATTDTSLIIEIDGNRGDLLSNVSFDIELPQPSKGFIEKYIKEYNKGNIITDILIEYEILCKRCKCNNFDECWSAKDCSRNYSLDIKQLKISKDNTITIHPIKTSWTREEVEKLCRKAVRDNCNLPISQQPYSFKEVKELENKWIEENL